MRFQFHEFRGACDKSCFVKGRTHRAHRLRLTGVRAQYDICTTFRSRVVFSDLGNVADETQLEHMAYVLVCGSRHSRRLRAFRRLHLGPGCWHGASIEFLPFKKCGLEDCYETAISPLLMGLIVGHQ